MIVKKFATLILFSVKYDHIPKDFGISVPFGVFCECFPFSILEKCVLKKYDLILGYKLFQSCQIYLYIKQYVIQKVFKKLNLYSLNMYSGVQHTN